MNTITPSAFLSLHLPLRENLTASLVLEEQHPPSALCCKASSRFPTTFNQVAHKVKDQVEAASLVCVCFVDAKMLQVANLSTDKSDDT